MRKKILYGLSMIVLGSGFCGQSSALSFSACQVLGVSARDSAEVRSSAAAKNSAVVKNIAGARKKADAELLARAIDYFNSQKYHECLLILQPLDKHYKLNPRYRAYLGICLYQEWDYEAAVKCLDDAIPQLEGFAPQERSIYYWTDAESHFNLQRYQEAIPLYEKMLGLCHDNEKPDAYYRLGFCHLFLAENISAEEISKSQSALAEKAKAKECFEQALLGYLKYRNNPSEKARIAQIKHMIQGLK